MRRARIMVAVLATAFAQQQAWAWSGPSHAAVAAMAYRELAADPTLQSNLTDLLKNHPKFLAWQAEFKAKKKNFPKELDLGMFLFIRAATWPDDIRGTGNKFDHPNWHFVDYPLHPPTFTTGPSPSPDDDVLFGIKEGLDTLRDKNADPVARAAMLSWLIHLVGDIHQPLHCATLITATFKAPDGDRGGNGFLVYRTQAAKQQKQTTKLHSYWDQQLGSAITPDPAKALGNAKQLTTLHPRDSLSELSHGSDVQLWSFESRDDAISDAYEFKDKALVMRRVLPTGYATNAKNVAKRRLALAGYRLSDTVHQVAF
jgi:S1/P1 nuclease